GTDDQGWARALRRGPYYGRQSRGPPLRDPPQGRTRMTIPDFRKRKAEGRKIVVVTAYDALFTRIAEEAGLEVLLVGDSLGVVVQGKKDTLSVTMDDMLYHTRLVAGAAQHALVIADMPFLSYQVSVEEAVRNAGRFLQAGAAAACYGHLLVHYDLRGLFEEFVPKFVKPYAHLRADALQALRRFREEVEQGKFPTDSESYH